MQLKPYLALAILLLTIWFARGQGTFVYDQQSSTDEFPAGNSVIQQGQLIGQSFIPSLSSVDFIRLNLNDYNRNNGIGATLSVNLRTDSISGNILSSTTPVSLPDNFANVVNFFFPVSVALIPGVTYYFQPVVQSGDLWSTYIGEGFNYPLGTAFSQGQPLDSMFDMWFREGTFVPEPSALTFLFIGTVIGIWRVRRKPASKQRAQ